MKKLFCLVVLLVPAFLFADAPAKQAVPEEHIRLKKDDDKKIEALEIAITRYEGANNVTVDLVGVVHIGDTKYYKELNKRLAKYDVVLYELVAPEGTKPNKKEKSNNLLSMLPKVMSVMLDLDMQLEVIDYSKKHFVHADMSPEEMKLAMEKRGETPLTLGLSVLLDSLKQQAKAQKKGKGKELDYSQAIENPNLLKQQMAQQMVDSLELGETMKKLIVEDRNKKCCEVLDKQLNAGKKKIAIFYGAAHNEDFDKRLRARKMTYKSQEWLTAWGGLTDDPPALEERLLKALLKNK